MIIKPFETKYRDDLIFMVLQAKDALGRVPGINEAYIHRLFIKPNLKHQGIGTALLKFVEDEMKSKGIKVSLVHLGSPKEDWFESYSFYPKHGYIEYEPGYMRKNLWKKLFSL